MKYFLSFFVVLFLVSGCQTLDNRGQFIDDKLFQQLKDGSGSITKQQVVELVGTPTLITEYSPDIYYYISSAHLSRAFFVPTIMHQQVLKLVFNKQDLLDKVELISEDQVNHSVSPAYEYTKPKGNELTGIQKFIKNIGRYRGVEKANKRTSRRK